MSTKYCILSFLTNILFGFCCQCKIRIKIRWDRSNLFFFSVKFTCSDWCHAVVAVGRIMFKFGYNSTCSEERHFWLFFLGGFSLVDGNASAKDLSHFYIYTSGTNIFMQLDGIAFIKQLNFCLPPATSFLFF